MNETCSTISWTENTIRRIAGLMILASLALGWFIHPGWYFLIAFVGLNLFQSSFTGFCPLEMILRRVEPGRQARSESRAG